MVAGRLCIARAQLLCERSVYWVRERLAILVKYEWIHEDRWGLWMDSNVYGGEQRELQCANKGKYVHIRPPASSQRYSFVAKFRIQLIIAIIITVSVFHFRFSTLFRHANFGYARGAADQGPHYFRQIECIPSLLIYSQHWMRTTTTVAHRKPKRKTMQTFIRLPFGWLRYNFQWIMNGLCRYTSSHPSPNQWKWNFVTRLGGQFRFMWRKKM